MENDFQKIFVAGHRGLVGSAIVRRLRSDGIEPLVVDKATLDLRDERAVGEWMAKTRPDAVILAAARVGGIHANNTQPVDFLLDNLRIQNAVIPAAFASGVRKLVFLGSSCIYPKLAPQPIVESALMTGPLEPTNDAYALAKIAGIRLCQAYRQQYGFSAIALMPTNLYGPNDNFHPTLSHVLPGLIRRFHEARIAGAERIVIWGTGTPRREFLHVDDLADACWFLMRTYDAAEVVNIGVGKDISILELAKLIAAVVGFDGSIDHDLSKPDGTPRKLLDVGKLDALGWKARIGLEDGIRQTYRWYCDNEGALR
jgi:GDP-L-fucose synthase